jgi:sterol desaturase/sphingolipid hydroxylase (fatty acid hydroxylase superfamily)
MTPSLIARREIDMEDGLLASATTPVEYAILAKRVAPVLLLAMFWCWETWWPFFGQRDGRLKHAAHNLAIALFNTLLLGVLFGVVTTVVVDWTSRNEYGLLNSLSVAGPIRFVLALVLLDGWIYLWHRANHVVPLLWRFHRMHHSDRNMDVTTATRFHIGEHVGSSVLRLALIPLLGLEVWNIVVYDTLVIASTQFHHADIRVGRLDRWLRLFIVTPQMHKVHHSDQQPETDSNYSTVLSIWDRIAGTFRMRHDPKTIVFGLKTFTEPSWQSWWGMMRTPFVNVRRSHSAVDDASSG